MGIRPGQKGWMVGLRGERRKGSRSSAQLTIFSFLFSCHVKGDPYPELCAIRAEGFLSISFVVATAGTVAGFLCKGRSCMGGLHTYPFGMNGPEK